MLMYLPLCVYLCVFVFFSGRSGRHGCSEQIYEEVEAARHSGLKMSDRMTLTQTSKSHMCSVDLKLQPLVKLALHIYLK